MNDQDSGKVQRIYSWEDKFRGAVEGLRFKVRETLLQCERFAWIAEEIRDEVSNSTVEEWEGILNCPDSRTSARERALIALALLGSVEAGRALDNWNPEGHPERLRLLWQVAKVEWENRAKGNVDLNL